jgi:LDH2 family malate/lactate/ureidoglycolate dehydrogenase
MNEPKKRSEDPDFLQYVYEKLWQAAGASEEHARSVARGVSLGDRMGKLTQGMGVLDVIFFSLEAGCLDMQAVPKIVDEGPSWVLYDGGTSTGFWTLELATRKAIEKAREHGISIAMGRNHNDAGSFYTYTSLALEQDMLAIATNNSVPIVSPWGGRENKLSGAPFSAAVPGGEEYPLVTDIACIDAHDGNWSEAAYNGTRLKGKFLVDPDTFELTDDPAPYILPVEGYGRICGSRAASVFGGPRLYAMNIFTEMLATLIVPGSTITPDLPCGPETAQRRRKGEASVGGSCVIVIDPSHFGPIEDVKQRSDRFVRAVKSTAKLPGVEEIFLPGERGHKNMAENRPVSILESHWEPFVMRVAKYGLDINSLRKDWAATRP